MNFELRGTLGRVTDAVKARIPKWTVRANSNRATVEKLEANLVISEQIAHVTSSAGWAVIKGYLDERKASIQSILESQPILSQEKALELASAQGRIKELRLLEDWVEIQKKRGVEAAKELAKRKEK